MLSTEFTYKNNFPIDPSNLSRSISLPFKNTNKLNDFSFNSNLNNNMVINKHVKFFNISNNYNYKNLKNSFNNIDLLLANSNELVQLISYVDDNTDLANVKLVNRLGSGIIPIEFLIENKSISDINQKFTLINNNNSSISLSTNNFDNITTTITRKQSNLSSPASPASFNSFSIAANRSLSTSSIETESSQISTPSTSTASSFSTSLVNSISETLSLNNLNDIVSCKIISIKNVKNRLQYNFKINIFNKNTTINNQSTIIIKKTKFYSDFYKLHVYLLSLQNTFNFKIPNLPPPSTTTTTTSTDIDEDTDDRLEQINDYLTNLLKTIKDKDICILNLILIDWLNLNIILREFKKSMLVKIHLHDNCYAIKSSDIKNFYNLNSFKNLVYEKIKKSNSNLSINSPSTLNLTCKIDGWYIIDLKNDEIFNQILNRIWMKSRIVLTVTY